MASSSAPPQAPPTQAQQEYARLLMLWAKKYHECNEVGQAMLDRAVFGAWREVGREEARRGLE